MINPIIIFQTVGIIFLLLVAFYTIGLLWNYLITRSCITSFFSFYFNILVGMLLSISLYAIATTKGFTVLLPIPLLLYAFTRLLQKAKLVLPQYNIRTTWTVTLITTTLSVLAYYLYYVQGFTIDGDVVNYVFGDQVNYVRVAQNLNENGIENLRIETLYPKRFSVEPYHYGDIWAIAMVDKLFSLDATMLSVLVVAPLLNVISVLGLLPLFAFILHGKKIPKSIYLIIFVGFIGGFSLFFPSMLFPYNVDIYAHSYCNYTKLLWWSSLLPLILILIYNKIDYLIVCLLFIIGLGYVNVFPSLLLGAGIWLLYISIKRKQLKKVSIHFFIVSFLAFAFLYAFYAYYPSLNITTTQANAKVSFNLSKAIQGLRTSLNIFIGGGLQSLVYLPVFVIWIWLYLKVDSFKKSPLLNVLLFLILLTFASIVVWSLLFSISFESIQFFYNVFVVAMGIASLLTYLYCITIVGNKILSLLSFIFIGLTVFNNRHYTINLRKTSFHEISEIKHFISKVDTPRFVHYRNFNDYSNDIFGSATVNAMPLYLLHYFVPKYHNFSLNVPFTPLDSSKSFYPFQKSNIDWAPMSYFITLKENQGLDLNQLMIKFIKDKHIKFITTPESVYLPQPLQALVKDSLVVKSESWKIYYCP